MAVAAAAPERRAAGAPERSARTKQVREEITESLSILGAATKGELVALTPVGRWPELLASLPLRAELIVGGALLGIAQDLVRLLHLLELLFGLRLFADVGMVAARQLAIGALDLIRV